MKQPGQSDPDTLSYDRPRPQDGVGKQPPADYPATAVLPDDPGDQDRAPATARVRPLRTDPLAVGPAPHGSLSLTPPETPGSPVEPITGAFRPGE